MHPDPAPPPPPSQPAAPPRRDWRRPALALGLVAAFVLLYLVLSPWLTWEQIRAHVDAWKAEVEAHLAAALAAYLALYVVVTALSLPFATWLSLLGGALFGRWLGTAAVSVGATLGATLAFLSSRYLFRDAVQRRFGQRLQGINRGIERDGAWYLLTLRLLPVFPFFLVNLGMGLTPIPTATYALASWLGMLPMTFVFVNTGTELASLTSPRGIVSPSVLVSLSLVALLPLLLRWLVRRVR
jgi:uncharacterized membrane protein YdjX (TVP38/TMEM64 family)